MKTILQINSSARQDGRANQLANTFVQAWQTHHPQDRVVLRDLTTQPVPHLNETTLHAFFTPPEQRDEALSAAIRLSDALIAEIQGADVVVFAVPMYNFNIPSTLKAYFDHIARAGITFRYTREGPEGLLKGKRVVVLIARDGTYLGTPRDTQITYLNIMLPFLGMDDIEYVVAEGLAMGEERAAQALQQAHGRIAALAAG